MTVNHLTDEQTERVRYLLMRPCPPGRDMDLDREILAKLPGGLQGGPVVKNYQIQAAASESVIVRKLREDYERKLEAAGEWAPRWEGAAAALKEVESLLSNPSDQEHQ